jgi:drug/metabolite transporter (DMT)-like permease
MGSNDNKGLLYLVLIGAFLIYSFASVFSKAASAHGFLSFPYLLYLGGAILTLGIYAIIWQQIIKRIPVSDAYMFKGTSILFVLLLSHLFFGEVITLQNCIGAAIIIGGIALYAKA